MKLPVSDQDALQSLVRLVRRACLLSEQGDEAAAEELERTQLAAAIRDYRVDHGPGALSEERIADIFMAEQQRAADAVALAAMIIPQLVAARVGAAAPPPPTRHEPVARAHPAPDTSIPGLLDGMLADDSRRRRQS